MRASCSIRKVKASALIATLQVRGESVQRDHVTKAPA
jgi:hypothetical protein